MLLYDIVYLTADNIFKTGNLAPDMDWVLNK